MKRWLSKFYASTLRFFGFIFYLPFYDWIVTYVYYLIYCPVFHFQTVTDSCFEKLLYRIDDESPVTFAILYLFASIIFIVISGSLYKTARFAAQTAITRAGIGATEGNQVFALYLRSFDLDFFTIHERDINNSIAPSQVKAFV